MSEITDAIATEAQATDAQVLLIQFAKWPEAGKVKTRLMPALGEQGALDAHRRLTLTVLENLLVSGHPVEFWWDRPLASPPESAMSVLTRVQEACVAQQTQCGEDLGARMYQALSFGLERYHKVLIIGSDCPSVDAGYVAEAITALDHTDLVMGPSDDGGYVLIGARKVAVSMLDDVEWGSARVLSQTCQRLSSNGLTYHLLEPRWDVDEVEDWERFLRQSAGGL